MIRITRALGALFLLLPILAAIASLAPRAPVASPAAAAGSEASASSSWSGVAGRPAVSSAGASAGSSLVSVAEGDLTWVAGEMMFAPRWGLGVAASSDGKVYAIGGITVGSRGTVEEYDPGTVSWTTKVDMPSARHYLGVATASNGRIYAIGGYRNGIELATVEEYDPSTNTWTTKASMPTARYGLGVAAAANGRIYAIGGVGYTGTSRAVEEYDPSTDTWVTKTAMPTARSGLGVATAANGKIYAIGGKPSLYSYTAPAPVEEYDPETDTWTSAAGMPTARLNLAAVAASNGKIYAIGGQDPDTGDPLDTVEEYDPVVDAWASKARMAVPRYGLGAATTGTGKIYAIGGHNDTYLRTVEEASPPAQILAGVSIDGPTSGFVQAEYTFTAMTNPGSAAAPLMYVWQSPGHSPVTHTNGLSDTASFAWNTPGPKNIQVTAKNAAGAVTATYEFNLVSDLTWTARAGMPTPRGYLGVAAAGGRVYAIGGHNDSGDVSTVEEFDPAGNNWAAKAPMPTARHGLAAVSDASGKIFAIGGWNGGASLRTVEVYDPGTNTWTTKANMPTARQFLGAAASNGKVYAIGGLKDGQYLATVEEYDPTSDTWTTRMSMPTPRWGLGVAAASNGKIYAIGGYGNGGSLAVVEEYDPIANTWTTKASMPTARWGLAVAATIASKVYAVGGQTTNYVATTEEYDMVSNTWVAKASLQTERLSLGMASTSDGKLYAIGGYNSSGYLDETEEATIGLLPPSFASISGPAQGAIGNAYAFIAAVSPASASTPFTYTWQAAGQPTVTHTNGLSDTAVFVWYAPGTYTITVTVRNAVGAVSTTSASAIVSDFYWTTRASVLTTYGNWYAYNNHKTYGAAAANGMIYELGQNCGSGEYITYCDYPYVYEYSPRSDVWTSTGGGLARSGLAVVAAGNGKIYALGGDGGGSAVNEFDPIFKNWATRASMPTSRSYLAAAAGNGRILAIGGYNAGMGGFLSTVEEYNPSTNTWVSRPAMPGGPRSELAAATAANGKIYVIGGRNGGTYLSSVLEYDPATGAWATKANMPTARSKLAAVAAGNGKVYAIGGWNGSTYLATVEEYDPASNTWVTRASMPTARAGLGAALAGSGRIYAVGGTNGSGNLTTVEEATVPLTAPLEAPTGTPTPTATASATPTPSITPTPAASATVTATPAASTTPAVTIYLLPFAAEVGTGKFVTVEVWVNTNKLVASIDTFLDFEPGVLAVVNPAGTPSATNGIITSTAMSQVNYNQADNNAGQVNYSAGIVPGGRPISGTFLFASVRFSTTAPSGVGGTLVRLHVETDPFDQRGTLVADPNGNPVAATFQAATLNVVNTASIVGRVELQARGDAPNTRWALPLTLTLHSPGIVTPTVTLDATTDATGQFTLSGITPGTYDVRVVKSHSLANKRNGVALSSGPNRLDLGLLLEGDANNDGVVNSLDYAPLSTAYFKWKGQTGFDERVDFNDDGRINSMDYAPLSSNYFRRSDTTLP